MSKPAARPALHLCDNSIEWVLDVGSEALGGAELRALKACEGCGISEAFQKSAGLPQPRVHVQREQPSEPSGEHKHEATPNLSARGLPVAVRLVGTHDSSCRDMSRQLVARAADGLWHPITWPIPCNLRLMCGFYRFTAVRI